MFLWPPTTACSPQSRQSNIFKIKSRTPHLLSLLGTLHIPFTAIGIKSKFLPWSTMPYFSDSCLCLSSWKLIVFLLTNYTSQSPRVASWCFSNTLVLFLPIALHCYSFRLESPFLRSSFIWLLFIIYIFDRRLEEKKNDEEEEEGEKLER